MLTAPRPSSSGSVFSRGVNRGPQLCPPSARLPTGRGGGGGGAGQAQGRGEVGKQRDVASRGAVTCAVMRGRRKMYLLFTVLYSTSSYLTVHFKIRERGRGGGYKQI